MSVISWIISICLFNFLSTPSTYSSESKDLQYINEELAFSLSLSSENQRFLEGELLENINRDAIVGVVDRKNKFYSLIIVSRSQKLSVEEFARVTLDELPVAGKKISLFEKTSIQGNPGINTLFQGRVQDHLITYQIDFIYFKNIIYQHVSFQVDAESSLGIKSLKPNFNLLLGLDPQLPSIDDSNLNFGLTWFLDDDEYVHLGYKLRLPAKIPGFKTLWGEKAQFFHPEASIAYEAEDGRRSIYAIATTDLLDLDSFINYWKKSFADSNSLKTVATKSVDYAILDFNSAEQVLRYQIRFEKGKQSSLALIQFSRPMDNLAFPASLLLGFKWLEGSEYDKSLRKLRNPKFSRLMLGDQESFYQNTYNNYGLGVSWKLPVSDVVQAGFQQDGHIESEYSLYIENYSQNYFATLQIQEDQFVDSLEYHQETLPKASNVKALPTKQKLGFYYTPFTVENQAYNYLHLTRRHNDLYVKNLVWSKNSINPEQFINQIKVSSVKALDFSSMIIRHTRLGFSLQKLKDFRVRQVTPVEIAPIGEVMQLFSLLREHELYVIKSALMNEDLLLDLYWKNKRPEIQMIRGATKIKKYIGLSVSERKFTIPLGDRPKILIQRTFRRGDTIFSAFTLVDPTLQDKSLFYEPFKLSFDREGWIP